VLAATAPILIAASVFFLALVAVRVLERAFEQYKDRYVVRSMNELSDMFLFVEPSQLFILNLALMVLFATVGFWLRGPAAGGALAVAGFFAPVGAVRFYRMRRLKRFEGQLSDALQQMANSLRAGLTLPQAIEHIGRESQAPLGQEFGLFVKEVKLGVAVEEGLANMAERVGSEDLELVVTSTNIARTLGGNMAEMFETTAATIRERFRLEGKIKSLTSQGKLQGVIVAALPLGVGFAFNWVRPDLVQPMFDGWYGWVLVGIIFVLEAIGFVLIRKIVTIDV
jgi:tight adherence protein B